MVNNFLQYKGENFVTAKCSVFVNNMTLKWRNACSMFGDRRMSRKSGNDIESINQPIDINEIWTRSEPEAKRMAPDLGSKVRTCRDPLNVTLSIAEYGHVKTVGLKVYRLVVSS